MANIKSAKKRILVIFLEKIPVKKRYIALFKQLGHLCARRQIMQIQQIRTDLALEAHETKKRILVNRTKAERNKAIKSGVKTSIKKVYEEADYADTTDSNRFGFRSP